MSPNRGTMVATAAGPEDSVGAVTGSGFRHLAYATYGLCVAASIAVWFLAIGAPLWTDEADSYWEIAKGPWPIPFWRDGLTFPAHSYILWLATKALGTSEIALRVPSALAMLGAAWLVYLAAREMFERDVAMIAVAVFCLEPVVAFASVDARAYACATLVTAAAVLVVLRLRRSESNRLAALLGLAAAGVMWFHFLFGVIAPALLVCFVVLKWGSGRTLWRQLGAAACGYVVGIAPMVPGLVSVFHTAGTHVYEAAPTWADPQKMVAPTLMQFLLFMAAAVTAAAIAAGRRAKGGSWGLGARDGVVCVALAGVPMGILCGVSMLTPMKVALPYYHMLSAAPGIALMWAWLARGLRRPWMQVVFCLLVTAFGFRAWPWLSVSALPSDGPAIAAAEKNASVDGAPVLICSDFVESNYEAMPKDAKESRLFAQLAYYRLSVPVVPLPKELNAEAMRVGGNFVEQAAEKHERFLAIGHRPSYPTLDWLGKQASSTYSVRVLGLFGDTKIMEFMPRTTAGSGGA